LKNAFPIAGAAADTQAVGPLITPFAYVYLYAQAMEPLDPMTVPDVE